MIGTWPQIDDDSELARLRAQVAALEADKAALTLGLSNAAYALECAAGASTGSAASVLIAAWQSARATLAAHGTK